MKATSFTVSSLFGALRGALRPLQVSPSVELIFDRVDDMPELLTDEAKVAQILRNLISNALKFTEKGEVRVRAQYEGDSKLAIFSVRDTGIGIAPASGRSPAKCLTPLCLSQMRPSGTSRWSNTGDVGNLPSRL